MKNIYGTAPAVFALVLLSACSTTPHKDDSTGKRSEECRAVTEPEIKALFERWNESLQTGDVHRVVANYAQRSILLPTLSNKPRITVGEKEEYFEHFLENQPSGKIDFSFVGIGCNSAFDAGLYTFTFKRTGAVVPARYTFTYAWDGKQWLITSHHSSLMPEKTH
jgi:hypothetical protein